LNQTLVIGFGNPDRQDDGVAWHVLHALAIRMNLPAPDSYEEEFSNQRPAGFFLYSPTDA